MKQIIVKIQQSLYPANGLILIYDKSRSWVIQDYPTPEIKRVIGSKQKSFWLAELLDKPKNEPNNNRMDIIRILRLAEWQDW